MFSYFSFDIMIIVINHYYIKDFLRIKFFYINEWDFHILFKVFIFVIRVFWFLKALAFFFDLLLFRKQNGKYLCKLLTSLLNMLNLKFKKKKFKRFFIFSITAIRTVLHSTVISRCLNYIVQIICKKTKILDLITLIMTLIISEICAKY